MVLGHHFRHVPELIIKTVEILRCAAILVELFGALNESVEFHKGIWAQSRRLILCRGIRRSELGCEIG